MDVLPVQWTLCWYNGHYDGTMDILLIQWTFCVYNGHFARAIDILVVHWTSYWCNYCSVRFAATVVTCNIRDCIKLWRAKGLNIWVIIIIIIIIIIL